MLSFVVLIAVCSVILPNAALAQYASECRLPNQQNGLCMPVKSCKSTFDVFQKALAENRSITPVEARDLQQTYCGMFSNEPHVCCPTSDVQLNPEGMEILKRQTKCGEFSTDKISNGEEAALFSYPWMALLIYNDTRDPYKCGGALISERYVITAAHCIKPDLYQVRLGEHRISTEKDCIADGLVCAPPVVNVSIELVIPHYKYSSYINDIALIRLAQSFAPQIHIRPICLPIYDELRSSRHGSYIISGWGRTENKPLSDVLMAAAIPLVERPQCETILRKYRLRRPLTEAHICAGNRDLVDSCDGDSGGPMGIKDTYNGKPRFVQFGVVAFGVNFCGEGNAPNVYTNVSNYMQWITDNMKN